MSQQNLHHKKIVLSAFRCEYDGISEAAVGYNWVSQIAHYTSPVLLTPNSIIELTNKGIHQPNLPVNSKILNRYFNRINSAVKLDYFYFDLKASLQCRKILQEADLFHHITPIAPRYHSLSSLICKKTIIGPVGGGLKIPSGFDEIAGKEPFYSKLRSLDSARINFDPLLLATYKKASRILIVGKYMLDLLPKYLHEKCQLMLDVGIDLEDYCVLDPLIQASQNETKIQLLYVGRIVPYKGLSLLIEALSLLDIKLKSKIFLSIVGDDQGAYADHCKQLTRALNLEDCCTFYGKRRKEEVLTFYKNSNIFCFPSLAEAGGTVVLEAMSMGLPVITINRGGPAEMVDKSCGILIDAHSPNYVSRKIAEALSMLIMNRDKTIDLGKAARKKVQDNFTWQKKGQKLKEIYEEVLSE